MLLIFSFLSEISLNKTLQITDYQVKNQILFPKRGNEIVFTLENYRNRSKISKIYSLFKKINKSFKNHKKERLWFIIFQF